VHVFLLVSSCLVRHSIITEEREDVLKSLKDVNLPKFLALNVPLFEGILMDLLVGVEFPPPDYDIMTMLIKDNNIKMNTL
jgi:dynein heavy chain